MSAQDGTTPDGPAQGESKATKDGPASKGTAPNGAAPENPARAAFRVPATSQEHRMLAGLLFSLLFLLFVVPFTEATPFAGTLLRIGVTLVLLFATVIVAQQRRVTIFILLALGLTAPALWATMLFEYPLLFLGSCVLESAFFVAIAILLLNSVIRWHLASVHSIFGAISAYLLLGLAWAVLYLGLDYCTANALSGGRSTLDTASNSNEVKAFSEFVYFSFVTMSTLGYGDITPSSPLARTLTWMQSVVGQFYMAVLVAWMVSAIPGGMNDPQAAKNASEEASN